MKTMKTIKFLTYAIFVLFLGLAISSCKGDDGADGVDGIDGATGPAGADGNANVTSVTFPNFAMEIGPNDFVVPELTQSIVDTGVVLGYVTNPGGNLWFPLPYITTLDHIEIFVISIGHITLNSTFANTLDFRFVLIESSGKSAGDSQQAIYNELKNAGIDINDYYDVCEYYGINPK